MKKAFLLLGLVALVAVTSCEREEALNKVDTPQQTFEGDVAYIVVNINDVTNSGTRADDGGFEYGSEDEYAINDAHFYFYGGPDREFVAEATYEPSGTPNETTPTQNIEWSDDVVVALHGLSGKTYPSWLVTVLNKPAGFTAPNTLDEFATALAENNSVGDGTPGEYGIYTKGAVEIDGDTSEEPGELNGDGDVYFTMCTSSYAHENLAAGADSLNTYYFANPVYESNFALEELQTGANGGYTDADGENVDPIVVYVERLVAKTRVGLGSGLSTNAVQDADGETYYKIEVEEEVNGTVADVNLYVHLEGWELNGVSNNTYMAKRVDTSWESLGFAWNDATNYRSYWAMSTAYGDTDPSIWPTSSEGNDYNNAKNMNPYLRWFDVSEQYLHSIGVDTYGNYDCQYCGENTNTALGTSGTGVIGSKRHTAITNALVVATVGELDEDGVFTPSQLVRVNGILYTKDNYKVYAASHIYLYTYEEIETDTYGFVQLGPEYLEIVNDTDGYVHIELDREALGYVYDDQSGTWSAGSSTVTIYSSAYLDEEITVPSGNEYIDAHFNKVYGYMANGYTDGQMYYSIPIEHLSNKASDEGEEEAIYEGNYGMVRNHIYSITITGIENIGWGVFDPDEVIIPQEDIDTYSLTAQINILSWKLVEQSVTL